MTTQKNSFESVPNGTALTTANSGPGSDSSTAFDSITINSGCTLAGDTSGVTAAHGTTSMKVASGGTTGNSFAQWNVTGTTGYGRAAINFNGAYSDCRFGQFRYGSGALSIGAVQTANSGSLSGSVVGGTVAFTLDTKPNLTGWSRIEWKVVCSATIGTLEVRLYNSPDSTTITSSGSAANLNTGDTFTQLRLGELSSFANVGPFWLDDVAYSDTDWLGPAVSAPTAVTLNDVGVGSDSATAAAAATISDTGTAATSMSSGGASNDTGHGTDSFVVTATVPLSETPVASDTISATHPLQNRLIVGANTGYPSDTPAGFASYRTAFPGTIVRRVYQPLPCPANISNTSAGGDAALGTVSFLSVKPSYTAPGSDNANITTLAASMPAGSYVTAWHEPENDMTGVQYVTMFRNFYATAKAANPNIYIGNVYMTYQWGAGRNVDNTPGGQDAWYAGDAYTDFLGTDTYWFGNQGTPKPLSADPDHQRWHAWAITKPKPLVIPEWGISQAFTDEARSSYYAQGETWLVANGYRMVLPYNTAGIENTSYWGGPGSWPLTVATWRDIASRGQTDAVLGGWSQLAQDVSTPAVVHSANQSTAASLTTATFTPPANSLVLAIFNVAYDVPWSSTPNLSISDTGPNHWNTVNITTDSLDYSGAIGIWQQTIGASSGPITVTATRTATTAAALQLSVIVITGAAADQSSAVLTTANSYSSASLQTTLAAQSAALVYCTSVCDANIVTTKTANATVIDNWSNSVDDTTSKVVRLTSPTSTVGPVTIGWTTTDVAAAKLFQAIEVLGQTTVPICVDRGVGVDTLSVDRGVAAMQDGGTAADSLTVTFTVAESGQGTDALAVAHLSNDVGGGVTSLVVTVAAPLADTGRGATQLLNTGGTLAERGAGRDTIIVTQFLVFSEMGGGNDSFYQWAPPFLSHGQSTTRAVSSGAGTVRTMASGASTATTRGKTGQSSAVVADDGRSLAVVQ